MEIFRRKGTVVNIKCCCIRVSSTEAFYDLESGSWFPWLEVQFADIPPPLPTTINHSRAYLKMFTVKIPIRFSAANVQRKFW